MEFAQKLVATRKGTIAVAAFCAVLAGGAIAVYLKQYRQSVSKEGTAVTVLVAKRDIARGTPGAAVTAQGLFTATTIRESQLREGAFSDTASLRGRYATREILRGQQLTAADFSASAKSLASSLTGRQRVVTVPLDSAHGLIGQVQVGDHVDVMAAFNILPINRAGSPIAGAAPRPVLKTIIQDVPVVSITSGGGGIGGANVSNVGLRLTFNQANDLAFASENGKVWLADRPAAGAPKLRPSFVTLETILLGVRPVAIVSSFRKGRR
jgi:Flp pilus assembly protein CpaB